MSKVIPVIIAGGIVTTALIYGVKLYAKGKAGNKIETKLTGFKLLDVNKKGLNSWVKYRAEMEIINPTNEKLEFTTPYAKLFIKNKQIASSEVTKKTNILKPKSKIPLNLDLKIALVDVLFAIPNIFNFIARKLKGEPPSQEVKMVYNYDSEGFTQEVTKKVII